MKNHLTERQKQLLAVIYQYITDTGYPPTFEEMRENLGVSSNQSIIDLLNKLKIGEYIKRDEGARSLAILPLGYKVLNKPPLVVFAGTTSAGSPLGIVEISGQWQAVSQDVAKLTEQVFLLKILGDSMINAGIDDGDAVLVKSQKEFVSGDVVLARISNDEATVKRFISNDKPPYVYLKPENPKYPIIPFTDDMQLEGKVISVFKSGNWQPVP